MSTILIVSKLILFKAIGTIKTSHEEALVSRSAKDFTSKNIPLDQRLIPYNRSGVKDNISGLNKVWAELKYEWIPYIKPPKIEDLNVVGASETWCEGANMVTNDLNFLLKLPHHKVSIFCPGYPFIAT